MWVFSVTVHSQQMNLMHVFVISFCVSNQPWLVTFNWIRSKSNFTSTWNKSRSFWGRRLRTWDQKWKQMKTRKKNKSSSCMGWSLHKWGSTQFYRNSSSEKYDCVFTPSSVRQRRKGRLAWFHLISRNCMDIYTGISYKEVEGNFSLHLRRNFNWNIS